MIATKDPRADAKLQNLPQADLDDLWRFRHPEDGGEKITLEAIAVQVPRLYGFTISLAALSGFYAWLGLKRRLDQRNELIDQLLRDAAAQPGATPEAIERKAQVLFMTETVAREDLKGFAKIAKIGQDRVKLDQNKEVLKLNQEKVSHDERRLKLLEAKAAKADAAKEVLGTTLSPEEQNRRLREILK